MANYKKMYALLCGAVDDAISNLEKIPQARTEAEKLKKALLQAEEIYVGESNVDELDAELKAEFLSDDPDYERIESILDRINELTGESSGGPPITFDEFMELIKDKLEDQDP